MTGAPPGADPGAHAIFEKELELAEEDSEENESELLPLGQEDFPTIRKTAEEIEQMRNVSTTCTLFIVGRSRRAMQAVSATTVLRRHFLKGKTTEIRLASYAYSKGAPFYLRKYYISVHET